MLKITNFFTSVNYSVHNAVISKQSNDGANFLVNIIDGIYYRINGRIGLQIFHISYNYLKTGLNWLGLLYQPYV